MAEFTTACPHCNTELQAQTEWIGMEAECTECQTSFVIQAPVTVAAPVVQVAASAEPAISNPPVEPFLKKHKKWCVIAALWIVSIVLSVFITAQITQNSSYSTSSGSSGSSGSSSLESTFNSKQKSENNSDQKSNSTADSPQEIETQVKKLINEYLSAAQKKSYYLSKYFIEPSDAYSFNWIINSWNIVGSDLYDKWDDKSNLVNVFIDFAMPTGGNVKKHYKISVKKHKGEWKISSVMDY